MGYEKKFNSISFYLVGKQVVTMLTSFNVNPSFCHLLYNFFNAYRIGSEHDHLKELIALFFSVGMSNSPNTKKGMTTLV